jgi:hypothetical protein
MPTIRHANGESHNEESYDPKVRRLPREEGAKRDWGKPGLTSPSAMFKPRNKPKPSLVEFEKEGPTEGMEGAHRGNTRDVGIGIEASTGLRGRDKRNAAQTNPGVAADAANRRYLKLKQNPNTREY